MSELEHALEAGKRLCQIKDRIYVDEVNGRTYYTDEDNDIVEISSLRKKPPANAAEIVSVSSFSSFIKLLKANYDLSTTNIFYNVDVNMFEAITDFGTLESPGFKCKKIRFYLELSKEHNFWSKNAEHKFSHATFAQMLNERYLDIIEPDSSKMLSIINNLSVGVDTSYAKAMDINNDSVQFSYTRQVSASSTDKSGTVTIPKQFVIGIPLLQDPLNPEEKEKEFELKCNLRYSLREENLRLWFSIDGLSEAIDTAIVENIKKIESALSIPVYLGRGLINIDDD